MTEISITLNGEVIRAEIQARLSLADFIREHQGLTGTHLGCEHGVCGACTIMLDDEPARSCITLAVAADAREVRTIEGFDEDPVMGTLRDQMREKHGVQCGYCTPGMMITAHDVVSRLPDADRDRIRLELSGNICRCTGYIGIIDAIEAALQQK